LPILTAPQIAGYAIGAGLDRTRKIAGTREDAVMVAIALGESGGNTRAHNDNPGTRDNSYGLWQINMYGQMGPDRRREFGLSSNDQLFDPATNARAMVKILRSQGVRAWSVFSHGTYLRHLSTALRAVENPSAEGLPQIEDQYEDGGGILGDVGAIAGAIGGFADFVTDTKNWVRVAQFVGGGILIIVAVVMFTGKSVSDIVPAGKALKAVRSVAS
jgi:hypothetical protein